MNTEHDHGHGPGPLVDVIAGARPNFMKIAPILHAIQQRQAREIGRASCRERVCLAV